MAAGSTPRAGSPTRTDTLWPSASAERRGRAGPYPTLVVNTMTSSRQLTGAPCSVTRLAATSTPAKSKSAPGGSPETPARPATRRGWKACTKLHVRTQKRSDCAFPGQCGAPRDTYPHHRAQTPAGRSGMPAISAGACLLELTPSRPLLYVNKASTQRTVRDHTDAQSKHGMLCLLQRDPGATRLSPSPPAGCQAVPLEAISSSLGPRLLFFGTRPATA